MRENRVIFYYLAFTGPEFTARSWQAVVQPFLFILVLLNFRIWLRTKLLEKIPLHGSKTERFNTVCRDATSRESLIWRRVGSDVESGQARIFEFRETHLLKLGETDVSILEGCKASTRKPESIILCPVALQNGTRQAGIFPPAIISPPFLAVRQNGPGPADEPECLVSTRKRSAIRLYCRLMVGSSAVGPTRRILYQSSSAACEASAEQWTEQTRMIEVRPLRSGQRRWARAASFRADWKSRADIFWRAKSLARIAYIIYCRLFGTFSMDNKSN
ncbi:2-C-methyl-D-erythritol 4-phosphatecytidylyltransferase [Striga asiatica]|uniref:2-C-methyl-D-erythritol 4-phosphatecytidylyltransferase n=1 Tax=Striga asiatica TaxID=4170 RepID=A0A5A7RGR3_STRAF|nr:2-C-methyl-D-erythritol 4-phosphatecytidylyltransferase [Striga asiatica]